MTPRVMPAERTLGLLTTGIQDHLWPGAHTHIWVVASFSAKYCLGHLPYCPEVLTAAYLIFISHHRGEGSHLAIHLLEHQDKQRSG